MDALTGAGKALVNYVGRRVEKGAARATKKTVAYFRGTEKTEEFVSQHVSNIVRGVKQAICEKLDLLRDAVQSFDKGFTNQVLKSSEKLGKSAGKDVVEKAGEKLNISLPQKTKPGVNLDKA